MIKIENIIRQNKEAFNADEPEVDHFERFSGKLDQMHAVEKESWLERNHFTLRIAAVVVIFVTIGVVFYSGGMSGLKTILTDQIVSAELPEEVQEVMIYYNVITDNKVAEIDEAATSDLEAERVKEMAMAELKSLEQARESLESEYQQNPDDQRILNALVINQRKKAEVLDRILKLLNQIN